jgi:hypothetical protein
MRRDQGRNDRNALALAVQTRLLPGVVEGMGKRHSSEVGPEIVRLRGGPHDVSERRTHDFFRKSQTVSLFFIERPHVISFAGTILFVAHVADSVT